MTTGRAPWLPSCFIEAMDVATDALKIARADKQRRAAENAQGGARV